MKNSARIAAKSAFAIADVLFAPDRPGPRILIYHQVGTALGREMEVTESAFEHQLDWLVDRGEVVRLEEALRRRGEDEANRLFVITFDDGYQDLFTTAFPHLARRELPFHLYLTTRPVETREALTPGGSAEPLTWGQVRAMLDSGLMTVGAHTHSHADLRRLDGLSIRHELDMSNELIDQRLGIEVRDFAYPWGYWAENADAEVRLRYQTAVLGSGVPVLPGSDPLLLNRVPIQLHDGEGFFKRKMLTGMGLEDRVRRKLTGYVGP